MNGALVPLEVGARAPQLDLARLQPALAAPPRYLLLCFLPLAGFLLIRRRRSALRASRPNQ